MYQRIMAAIDSNFATSPVLEAAIQTAGKFGARLALCHALDDSILSQKTAQVVFPDGVRPIMDSLRSDAEAFLNEAAVLARQRSVETDVLLIESETEHVPEMLIRAAKEWQADLLVVGARQSQGVGRLLGGSVAEQLARKATVSLLLVKPG
jgi:nucleotide-binding universal stress UspA family protein